VKRSEEPIRHLCGALALVGGMSVELGLVESEAAAP